ncbi:MAG: Hsp20 family protein [Candidatus Berkelbacteria bacterium]|nr:Hsp20 family protein [Candidatus Berkelbacteria bacterium]
MSAELRLLLRDLRQAQDLSQDELARQLGISRQSIISLEQGAYLPSFPLLINMIHFFNCSLEELVEGAPKLIQQENNQNIEEGGEQDMQIARWDPFQAIDKMHDEMGDVVERTFGRVDWPRALGTTAGAMNIHETDKEYEIQVQVPGYKEDEINLEFSDDTLTISGEKKVEEQEEKKNTIRREWTHASFSRQVRFAQPIKDEKVEAKLSDGTLTITAPKVEPVKPKIKKIEVKK